MSATSTASNKKARSAVIVRLREHHERLSHESQIAVCECGARVRRGLDGVWVHTGTCKVVETLQ